MSGLASLLSAVVLGYLIGGIPIGYLVGRLLTGKDVRAQGSGKTGATNVRRLLGWKGFILVVTLDLVKGALAVLVMGWVGGDLEPWAKALAGLAAVVGHNFPVYLGFHGGRGVATGMGAMVAMIPWVALICFITVPVMLLSRYVSLGSITGAILVPSVALVMVLGFERPWAYFIYALIGGAIILIAHKDNIQRLLSGTERKL